jgi:tellurite methyltransferase
LYWWTMNETKWDRRHADAGLTKPLPLIEQVARQYPPGCALDLACGLGRHALLLAEYGWAVTALDASAVAIGRLRETAAARGLRIEARVENLEADDFDIPSETFDLICDSFYLQRSLITRIQKGTRAGGLVAFALPVRDDALGVEPMNPDYLVEPGEVRNWFGDWEVLEYKEDREAGGGRLVAGLIARRPSHALTSK